jgi:hypothetical protein
VKKLDSSLANNMGAVVTPKKAWKKRDAHTLDPLNKYQSRASEENRNPVVSETLTPPRAPLQPCNAVPQRPLVVGASPRGLLRGEARGR